MTRLLLFLVSLLATTALFSQSVIYSKVKIDLSETPIETVAALGLETDHGIFVPGKHLINVFSQSELEKLSANGIVYEVLIPDAQADYRSRLLAYYQNGHSHDHSHDHNHRSKSNANSCNPVIGPSYQTPANYQPGSMGGYLTYNELLSTLDSMTAKYPHLISQKTPIGNHRSHEGRPIYFLRLSDNPNTEEDQEPELLYTALHHAREPNSLSQMIFYIWYLLENYETNDEVKYLVDNTEMYFVPCINPDGYVYNEQTNPQGGGFWRKNRRVNGDGSFGVDLNRNYSYRWAHDNEGSSPNTDSDSYRGPEAFSEPEVQAVRDLCIAHNFRITLNYHTFGNLLIYPWGFENQPTPHQPTFSAFGQALTNENNYAAGTGLQTVGYTVNGGSDDWMYGDSTSKPPIFSFTPEVGQGFWPTPDKIDQQNKDCLKQNMVAAHLLHNYVEVAETTNSDRIVASSGNLALTIKKYGLESGVVEVSTTTIGDNVSIVNNGSITTNLAHLESSSYTPEYLVSDQVQNGEELVFLISINNGALVTTDTLRKIYLSNPDEAVVLVDENATAINNWTATGSWGLTTEHFVSAPSSFTDSPGANYDNSQNSSMRFNAPVDLSNASSAKLEFKARWDIERDYDYAQVMISTDGENFTSLCGIYSKPGGDQQDPGQPIYDGTQTEWVSESINLASYLGQTIHLQFRFVSDVAQNGEGFYFDDLRVVTTQRPSGTSELNNAVLTSEVAPNPFNRSTSITLNLPQSVRNVTVDILNPLGQNMSSQQFGPLVAGKQKLELATNKLPTGIYYFNIQLDGKAAVTKKVVKVN